MSRTKEQWLAETGGFRIGESAEDFQQRCWKIRKIRNFIAKGVATAEDIDELATLLGAHEGEE